MSDRKHIHLRFNLKDSYDSRIYEAITGAGYRNGVRFIKDCIAQCAGISPASEKSATQLLSDLCARVSALEKKAGSIPAPGTKATVSADSMAESIKDDVLGFLNNL